MKNTRLLAATLWVAVLLVGMLTGYLLSDGFSSGSEGEEQVSHSQQRFSTKLRSRDVSPRSSSERYLQDQTKDLRAAEDFDEAIGEIYQGAKSPLRANAIQSFHIHDTDFAEWEVLLGKGQVNRLEVLRELGAHLASLDPERAMRLMCEGSRRFNTMDELYAFRDPLIREATRKDPEVTLKIIKNMRRGGAQMDNGRFFSSYWAHIDPRAASGSFSDLVQIRNMRMGGSVEMPNDAMADLIMKSWVAKNAEEASEYLTTLPEGSTRKALTKAYEKFTKKK